MTATTIAAPPGAAGSVDQATLRRAIAASALGNATEWFDYGIYAYGVTYISAALFPGEVDDAVLFALATFAISFLVRPLGGLFWGPLGDRWGFKIIYVFALASSILGVTTLIIGNSAVPIYAAFVLLGVGGSGWMLASTTMVLEFGNVEDIPMRLAFVTTLEGVIAATGPVLAGVLVATSGFKPLFAIVLAAVIAALIFLIWKVREPRHREPAI